MRKIFLAFLLTSLVATPSFAEEVAAPEPQNAVTTLPEPSLAKPEIKPVETVPINQEPQNTTFTEVKQPELKPAETKPETSKAEPKNEPKKEKKKSVMQIEVRDINETKQETKKETKKEKEVKKPEPKKEKPKVESEEKKPSAKLKATSWFSNIKDVQRMAVSFDGRLPKYSANKENGRIVLKFDTEVDYETPEIRDEFKGSFLKIESGNNPKFNVSISYNPNFTAKVSQYKTKVYIDITNNGAKTVEKSEEKKDEPKKDEKNSSSVKVEKEGNSEIVTVTFAAPTPMAAFQRFGYFWLVFDSSEKKEFKNDLLKKSAIFENVEKIQSDAVVFRLTLKKEVYASVKKLSNGWQIGFDPSIKFQPINPLTPEIINAEVRIPVKNVGRKIVINDDFTGDELQIITLPDEGSSVTTVKETNDLILEKTVQGIIYRNYGNTAQFIATPEGISISKAAVLVQPVNKGPRIPLFKFENWKQYSGSEFDSMKSTYRSKGGYEYGKFLFTQKLYNEAANYLAKSDSFDSQFLAAASQFLNGKPDIALDLFTKLPLSSERDEDELAMWKIAAEFELLQQKYNKSQILELPTGFAIPKNLHNYPPEIAGRLLLDLAERKINDGDIISAQQILNQIPKNAPAYTVNYKEFLQALIYDKSSKRVRAKEIWDKLAADYSDRKTRAHALYYSASQNYEMAKVNSFDTAKALDKIRVIWRGDRFEYQLLKKLGDIYLASANNIGALRTYREAVIHFPEHPDNEVLTERMRVAYANALTKDLSSPDKAFQAVALYYEFEELKPAGEDGDKITGELAEKLADFDLLKEASDLMEKSLGKITDPEDRALNATRVAVLRYMNHDPQGALAMLSKSESKQIPAYIQQERDVLAVNSMIELGQVDAAQKLLSKLPVERMNQVRVEILWKDKQWREMLLAYDSISEKTPADIMKIAIAKAMIDDKKGLGELRKKYEDVMKKSEYADLFNFTADSGSINYKNLPSSLNLDSARKLIDIYKTRLKKGGVDALTPEKKLSQQPKK